MKAGKIVNLPKLASLAAAALMAGCTSAPPAPPQVVKVSVYMPCVTGAPIVKPEFEFGKLAPPQATATSF